MSLSRRHLRRLLRADPAAGGEPPINLVPMIDILTVLVLYLLVGSIYKHLAILQLNLPQASTTPPPKDQPKLELTVTVRKDALVVSNHDGLVQSFARPAAGYDYAALGKLLAQIKKRASNEDSVVLLLEPDIPYDTLVQVMDAVRVFPADAGEGRDAPMFPGIAIGDAASASAAAAPAGAAK